MRQIPLDHDLAADLARRRRALRLSQNALALRAGLSETAVTKYETLRTAIPAEARVALERALSDAERDADGQPPRVAL
jgi:transcriptional regulator with XRE-family HTH domain